MLSLPQALERLLACKTALAETKTVSTFDALGRVLAADVASQLDVPPHDNSSMDGYALRVADVPVAGSVLPVSQRIAAGQVGAVLAPGSAARIFTGAPLPEGADAVLPQEQCTALDGAVRIDAVPAPGQWIRRRGEDVRADSVVLPRGTRLTPQALGLAASVGAAALTVVRRPRVALFSTGDELVMPGEPLKPGAIYNANRYTLRALLQQAGCEVSDLGIVPDRLDATREALRSAAAGPGAALALAREQRAYALVERGLWAAQGAGSGLAVLVEGDPRLALTYHVMRAFRAEHPAGKLLTGWLGGPNGRRVVTAFGHGYRAAG